MFVGAGWTCTRVHTYTHSWPVHAHTHTHCVLVIVTFAELLSHSEAWRGDDGFIFQEIPSNIIPCTLKKNHSSVFEIFSSWYETSRDVLEASHWKHLLPNLLYLCSAGLEGGVSTESRYITSKTEHQHEVQRGEGAKKKKTNIETWRCGVWVQHTQNSSPSGKS